MSKATPQPIRKSAPKKMPIQDAIPPNPPGQSILYIRLKTGEELIAFVERPGYYIEGLISEVKREKDKKKREKVLSILKNEKKAAAEIPNDIIELHFPTKMVQMPTRQGPAMLLMPWISVAISTHQMFRVSMNDITTMTDPDEGLKEYYMQVVQKIILSIALKMKQTGKIQVMTPQMEQDMELLEQQIKQEHESSEDEEIADTLAKARKPSIQGTSSGNNIPFVVINNEKKTLH